MPLDPESLRLGIPPHPDSTEVRVSNDSYRIFPEFTGASIPYDCRSYILYGYTILPGGTRVATRFEVDTRSRTLLERNLGIWHIAGIWYYAFEAEALRLLGVAPEESRPFLWTSNVPIETVEKPPYREGQVLHSRVPPVPYKPPYKAPKPATAIVRRGGRSVVKEINSDGWLNRARKFVGIYKRPPSQILADAPLPSIDFEVDEIVWWSIKARRPTELRDGTLVLTDRRVIYSPALVTGILGAQALIFRRREVIDVGLKPSAPSSPEGEKKMSLRLVLVGDREQLFIVANPMQALEQVSKHITPIGG